MIMQIDDNDIICEYATTPISRLFDIQEALNPLMRAFDIKATMK